MIRSAFRFGLRATLLTGCVVGVVTFVRRRSSTLAPDDGPEPWGRRPVAVPPLAAWVEPQDKACPATHPVKAKRSSNIFHVPGGLNYDRTVPDRCYRDEAAAIADGFVKSRR
ncbi:MAG: hypothetical protein E6G06_08785 [Actinobacteria bacterium]|nr:MAG: hypothetical protein E6G06_08785 [Actinomycetota bacterium]